MQWFTLALVVIAGLGAALAAECDSLIEQLGQELSELASRHGELLRSKNKALASAQDATRVARQLLVDQGVAMEALSVLNEVAGVIIDLGAHMSELDGRAEAILSPARPTALLEVIVPGPAEGGSSRTLDVSTGEAAQLVGMGPGVTNQLLRTPEIRDLFDRVTGVRQALAKRVVGSSAGGSSVTVRDAKVDADQLLSVAMAKKGWVAEIEQELLRLQEGRAGAGSEEAAKVAHRWATVRRMGNDVKQQCCSKLLDLAAKTAPSKVSVKDAVARVNGLATLTDALKSTLDLTNSQLQLVKQLRDRTKDCSMPFADEIGTQLEWITGDARAAESSLEALQQPGSEGAAVMAAEDGVLLSAEEQQRLQDLHGTTVMELVDEVPAMEKALILDDDDEDEEDEEEEDDHEAANAGASTSTAAGLTAMHKRFPKLDELCGAWRGGSD